MGGATCLSDQWQAGRVLLGNLFENSLFSFSFTFPLVKLKFHPSAIKIAVYGGVLSSLQVIKESDQDFNTLGRLTLIMRTLVRLNNIYFF